VFTGLVETVGTVISMTPEGSLVKIRISAPEISSELKLGDSVAVSGACLTVVERDSSTFSAEMMTETAERTKFAEITRGSRVNLERAMRLDSRLDGHLVSGHIDGTATLIKIERRREDLKYCFSADAAILAGIVEKGSVAIDGISLTVIDAEKDFFSVGIIPTTMSETTISELSEGSLVNIETDMIGKFVRKYLSGALADESGKEGVKNSLSWAKLVEYGWM
jgi:riboflavin synthase